MLRPVFGIQRGVIKTASIFSHLQGIFAGALTPLSCAVGNENRLASQIPSWEGQGPSGPWAGRTSSKQAAMKQLLIVTALIEVGASVSILCCPSATVALLLGAPLDTPSAISLGRVAGAALFALGLASWLAHYDEKSRAARGVVGAMVLYNLGTVVILVVAALGSQPGGVILWLAIVLHTAMTAWCAASLWGNQSKR